MKLNEIAKVVEGVLFVSGEGVDIDEFKTKAEYSPFDGWSYCGKAVMTIVKGKIVMNKIN